MVPKRINTVCAIACLGAILGLDSLSLAGSLDPPAGPVAPTMKTLAEVEPRTAIRAADLPLIISSPGSYYLAENITTAGNGISISSNDVTLDLMGFTLSGGTGTGIMVFNLQENITIRNGTVRGWPQHGIFAGSTSKSRFENLTLMNNGTDAAAGHRGLGTGEGCVVSNCTAAGNVGRGFWLGYANIVTGCTAIGNGGHGIYLGSGTVKECTARNNNGTGIYSVFTSTIEGCAASGSTAADGIYAGNGSVVNNCTAETNAGHGIVISIGGGVHHCVCRANGGDGIQAGFNAIILGNSCNDNATGINVSGRRTRIEGNSVQQNVTGIGGTGFYNFIIKNSAARNDTDYDIALNNKVGEIFDYSATPNVIITSSNPWANFVFE